MTTRDYTNKANELSKRFKATIKVGLNWENKPCLELLNADKAKTLKEMNVAKGFRIGFNSFGIIHTV